MRGLLEQSRTVILVIILGLLSLLAACNLSPEENTNNQKPAQENISGEKQQPAEEAQAAGPLEAAADEGNSPVEECIAQPHEYSWSYFDITKEQGSRGWKCLGNFQIENTSGMRLVFYPWQISTTGKDGMSYAGFGPGGRILESGEKYKDTVNYTAYNNGDITYNDYDSMFVLYTDSDCRWIDPVNPDEGLRSQLTSYIVDIHSQCTAYDGESYPIGEIYQQNLSDLTAGSFAATLVDLRDSTCFPRESEERWRNETFEITDEAIIISDDFGTRTYLHQGAQKYCRLRSDDRLECIERLQHSSHELLEITYESDPDISITLTSDIGYVLIVYNNTDQTDICYKGIQFLERVD